MIKPLALPFLLAALAGCTSMASTTKPAGMSSNASSMAAFSQGPPATWESGDGSRVTGTQVAVAPAGGGDIAYQLVKANPAMGQGAMTGVTYIQRVATRGGLPPATACAAASLGRSEVVKYQADYVFWTAK